MTDAEIQQSLQLQMDPLRVKCQVKTYPEYLQILVSPSDVVQAQKAPLTRVIRKTLQDLDLPEVNKVLLSSRGGQGSQPWETTLFFGDPVRIREFSEEKPRPLQSLENNSDNSSFVQEASAGTASPSFSANVFQAPAPDGGEEAFHQIKSSSSPYQILGVSPDATLEDIRKAYLKLAQSLHPDKLPSNTPSHLRSLAEEQFLEVQSAYIQLNQMKENGAEAEIYSVSKSYSPESSSPVTGNKTEGAERSYGPVFPNPVVGSRQYVVSGVPASLVMVPFWQLLLASALAGSALTLALVSLLNIAFLTSSSVTSSVTPTEPPVVSPGGIIPTPDPPPKNSLGTTSDPSETETFTADKITQFARALVAVQPLLKVTEDRLQKATTELEKKQIREEFDIAARKTIEAMGLTTSEYLQISQKALQDPRVGEAVKAATSRLP
jgi:hypothetical protein